MLRPSGRTQIVMTDTRSYLPTNDEEIIARHGKIMHFFRYLATGDSYTGIANSFRIGVSTTGNLCNMECTTTHLSADTYRTDVEGDWPGFR